MKNLFKIALWGIAATILATSCGKDKLQYTDDPGTDPDTPETEVGYLALAGMNVGVSPDIETLVTGSAEERSAASAPATRATQDADGAYKVVITNNASPESPVWEGTYADIKAMTTPLELQPGRYTIDAASPDAIDPVAWEKPAYAGSTEFTIVKKVTTPVNDLTCTLSNIKTTVTLSADLKSLFLNDGTNDMKTTVTLGESSCEFSRDETAAAFFAAVPTPNTMTITLTGSYNVKGEGEAPEYKPVSMTQKISNVKAGQWRKINISIEHSSEGNVQLVITVETWVYDERINVDVMSTGYTFGEEEIPDVDDETSDPNGPQVQLDGDHNITDPYRITSAMYDADLHVWNDRISVIATPQGSAAITDAYCVFGSDNADLLAALAAAGYTDNKVGLYTENSAADYMVSKIDASGRLLIKVNDAGMSGLFNYAGTHTVKIVVTDNQNRRTYTTMTISVVKGGGSETGPTVIGRNGYDFAKRYTISAADDPSLKVALDITSSTGITGFIVEIAGGEVLPDNELTGLNLAARMDLLNPATDAMKKRLMELGFLPKDGGSIAGATSLNFDISEFIPAMCILDGTGNCDFKLTVTDASGSTEKTLMFNVVH